MRISTDSSGRARRAARMQPSARQRWLFFVLGALLGGVLGYGYLTSGPGSSPPLLAPRVAPWILVSALVMGALAAFFPDAFLRPGGRFRWYHDDD